LCGFRHWLSAASLRAGRCGSGELKGAEDEEEALLTTRLAAYRRSSKGRGRERMLELELKGIGGCRSVDEQKELDHLKVVYSEGPSDSPLAKAIELRLAELRQQSK
jgi:hypothetical protein